MPGLRDFLEEVEGSDVWVESAARFTNAVGTPIVSADANEDGSAIADIYTLTFDTVVAETSANVTVTTQSPDNPYDGNSFAVALDGVTAYDNIVPGVDLVFSDAAGFLDTWAAQVRVGRYAGGFAAFGAGAGVPGAGRRHRVENTGTGPATACAVQIVNIVKLYPKVGKIFEYVEPFAEAAVEKLDGDQTAPYAITVENKTGSGAAITADIKVDGALVNVRDEDDNVTTSEDLTVVDIYTIDDGDLEGVVFKLSQSILNTATANILIFENLHTQIAEDIAGAAGTYGTTDVPLTEDGEAEGEITAGGVAYYWERTLVADGSSSSRNPTPGDLRLVGSVSLGAGWE